MSFMKEEDPTFDIENFEKQLQYIFETVYNSYLSHDLDNISLHCISEGLSYFRA